MDRVVYSSQGGNTNLFFNRGRPDSKDLEKAEEFAREICRDLK